jgi:hypothetical protein
VHIAERIELLEGFAKYPADSGYPAPGVHCTGKIEGGDEAAEGYPKVMNSRLCRATPHACKLPEKMLPALLERLAQQRARTRWRVCRLPSSIR